MDVDTIQKTCPTPPRGCYQYREPNHLVKDCPHRLDVQRLTAEQREELIEDLMALKDAVAEEEVGSSLEEDLARPAKSVPQSLLVNRFAVLDVEEDNTDTCEPIDAPPPSAPVRTALPWRPKWEKRLPR